MREKVFVTELKFNEMTQTHHHCVTRDTLSMQNMFSTGRFLCIGTPIKDDWELRNVPYFYFKKIYIIKKKRRGNQ